MAFRRTAVALFSFGIHQESGIRSTAASNLGFFVPVPFFARVPAADFLLQDGVEVFLASALAGAAFHAPALVLAFAPRVLPGVLLLAVFVEFRVLAAALFLGEDRAGEEDSPGEEAGSDHLGMPSCNSGSFAQLE